MSTIQNQKLRGVAYLCAPVALFLVSTSYASSRHFLLQYGFYTVVELFMHIFLGLFAYAAFFLCIPFGLYLLLRKSPSSTSLRIQGGHLQGEDSVPSILPWIKGCLVAFCIGFVFIGILLSIVFPGLH